MRMLSYAPTRRAAVVTAAIAPLWLFAGGGVALGWGAVLVMLVALVVEISALPGVNDVELSRSFPDTVGIGDEAEGEYEVRSHWPRALDVTLHDALRAPGLVRDGGPIVLSLPPNGVATATVRAIAMTRGTMPLGDVALRVLSPFGLVARTMRYPMSDVTLVAPSLAGVVRFRWLAVHHRLATAGVRDARRRGEGRSFARLRDYSPGDDPRHIDWKATARRGRPISREFTVEQSQTIYVLVDAGRSMTQLSGAFPRFEYALSSALVLADVAVTAGDRVGAMVFDDAIRALVPAQRGVAAVGALRSALVPLQPTLVEPDYAAAFRLLAVRQRKRALVVLITDVLDERAARTLLAHLTRGAARHLAIVVALRNEALISAAALPASDTPAAFYESAAAAEILNERATAMQRMRDAGVVVLDVAPDAMAAAMVSQYLELKSRGVL